MGGSANRPQGLRRCRLGLGAQSGGCAARGSYADPHARAKRSPMAAPDIPLPPSRSLGSAAAQIAATNVAIAVLGFVTGPILARALDAHGRGELAAIIAPLSLAPLVLIF